MPRVLNMWSTQRFWLGFLDALGIEAENIVFSSETSEEQFREFGKCFPDLDKVPGPRRTQGNACIYAFDVPDPGQNLL